MMRLWALLHFVTVVFVYRAVAQYSSDQCSWRGSGLSHESHRRDVEQVYLRCSQGLLEWLYPTGAVIVNLRPNTEPSPANLAGLHVCIKPQPHSQGSHLYLDRSGDLRLLIAESEQPQQKIHCFGITDGALFVEAIPKADISRRITAFRYELVSSRSPGAHLYPHLHPGLVTCEPCSDEEVLMAVCTSDFAGSGYFEAQPSFATDKHSQAVLTLSRLFRQKNAIFASGGAKARRWTGRVNVPTKCGVPHGGDKYLLTGSVHFGEAWLGCAPRYKDFVKLYSDARRAGSNPCQVNTD
ncbi:meteorin-like protein [Corythoichthys intestinalis]|uniref:meteorin-like protein n=1 Tax=Corythoichthys intestinalis TaxID=161448 RepID=UPI0025A55952|nr:meteorin-like protein [Corythoichthys intestinalis]XP_061792213.1 meteorin-like protein [Nerophis lumbriciformis]